MTVVFCFDEQLLGGRHRSGPRTQFMLESLAELGDELKARGSHLFVVDGDPATELRGLADRVGATEVHFSADVGPFARRRQREVKQAMDELGAEVIAHPGLFCVDALRDIRTGAGDPYTVFTPFHRNWLKQPRRDVLRAPAKLPPPGAEPRVRPPADAGVARARVRGARADARRRARRSRGAAAVPRRPRRRVRRAQRHAHRRVGVAPVPVPALRLSVAA